MNKKDFINKLSVNLHGIPGDEKKDILNDFEEHFNEGLLAGRTEEEISQSLGDPKIIARQLKAAIQVNKAQKNVSALNITKAVFATIGIGFFNLIFVLGPFIAIIFTLVALFICAVAFGAGGVAGFLTSIFEPIFPQNIVLNINPVAAVFMSIAVTCFGVLFFIGDIYLAKLLYRNFLNYIKVNIRLIREKEQE
jgi:uncharacterized membrane protein